MNYGTVKPKDPQDQEKVYFVGGEAEGKPKQGICRVILNDLSLTHAQSILFIKSDWESSSEGRRASLGYLLYRMTFMGFLWAFLVQSIYCDIAPGHYFLYLTNISLVLQNIYATLNFIQVANAYFCIPPPEDASWKQRSFGSSKSIEEHVEGLGVQSLIHDLADSTELASKFQGLIWFFYNLSWATPILVTFIFWSALFDPDELFTTCDTSTNLSTHALNTVLAILDIIFIGIPIHLSHAIYNVLFGLAYVLFTFLYEVADGSYPDPYMQYVYPVIDWGGNPSRAGINAFFIALIFIGIHIIGWILYKLRITIVGKLRCNQSVYKEHSTPKILRTAPSFENPAVVDDAEGK